jgi:hypothetical protein
MGLVGEILVIMAVVGILVLFMFMRASLDLFAFKKAREAWQGRRPIRWRDPPAWEESKRKAARWTLGVAGYVAAGISATSLFDDYERFVASLFLATPVVVCAWLLLMRHS